MKKSSWQLFLRIQKQVGWPLKLKRMAKNIENSLFYNNGILQKLKIKTVNNAQKIHETNFSNQIWEDPSNFQILII